MSRSCCWLLLQVLFAVAVASAPASAQVLPFTQHENIVYAEIHGVGLLMDVFTPQGEKNGLGIIDVISGSWHSDRGKVRDHLRVQTFHILCRKGYTVFAIRPGSMTKFSAPEMLSHLNQGIRWVKEHAPEYGIDPERLGLMGASAGGHLACLAAVTAEDGPVDPSNGSPGISTRVKATAVFFPPTDFLMYGDKRIDVHVDDRLGQLVRRLAFTHGLRNETADEVTQLVTQISPARLVTVQAPPFLLIHGDADPIVPLQQSETMYDSLKRAGVSADLIVKKGGGHPWLTMHEEVQIMADWFDQQLAKP